MPRRPALAPMVPLVAALVLLAGCSSRSSEGAKEALAGTASAGGARAPPAPLDPAHPLEALRASGDEVAARVGSFGWEGKITWTVTRPGMPPVQASETHRVRQLATGEFEVNAEIDPGAGPGSETGRSVVYAGGMTYARGRWAPFRERPTDRGHGARRFRDESFRLAAELADLYGPALAAEPAGEVTAAGRAARRFRLTLSGKLPSPRPPPAGLPAGGVDGDTQRRLAFLEGRVPAAAEGELVVDAATGVPLSVSLKGAFSEKDDPQLRAEFDLAAGIRTVGRVGAVVAPKGALADERKPKGVARALEAAGLRKKPAAPAEGDRDATDEGEPEQE